MILRLAVAVLWCLPLIHLFAEVPQGSVLPLHPSDLRVGHSESNPACATARWTHPPRWRHPLPRPGVSRPLIWGDQVFLLQSTDSGSTLLCLARKSGEFLWQSGIVHVAPRISHTAAIQTSPPDGSRGAPVTDGDRIYARMGNFLVAYGMDGKEVWSQPVEGTEPSSPDEATPVLTQSHCIIATRNPPQVLAFDKGSGRPAWTAPLTELESSSEVWARWHQGDPARVGELWAYDGRGLVGIADRDGSTSVQVKIPPGLVVARLPFATGGWIAVGAGQSSRVGAIRIARRGGQEAVSPTWTREDLKVSPRSVAIDGDRLYAATGEGEIYEVELARGRTVSRRSLPRNADDTGAPASLLARAGMVVAAHETGWVYLSHDSSRPSEVVTLKLDEPIRASLEFSKPDLFVRTARALWCIPVAPEHPGHSDRSR